MQVVVSALVGTFIRRKIFYFFSQAFVYLQLTCEKRFFLHKFRLRRVKAV
jgi:hypothetical protein